MSPGRSLGGLEGEDEEDEEEEELSLLSGTMRSSVMWMYVCMDG